MYKDFSPYRLLNTSLVEKDRKKGEFNFEKYWFLLLRALRGLKRCKEYSYLDAWLSKLH